MISIDIQSSRMTGKTYRLCQEIKKFMEDNPTRRIAVFSPYRTTNDIIISYLEKMGLPIGLVKNIDFYSSVSVNNMRFGREYNGLFADNIEMIDKTVLTAFFMGRSNKTEIMMTTENVEDD